jgi:K+-sensing histidine kinase KdpD
MQNRQVVLIKNIYEDARIPHDAYRPTFVKSLCMIPIREDKPLGAIGNYWASEYAPTEEQIKLLRVLANSCAVALENLELKTSVIRQSEEWESMLSRQKDLEMAVLSLAHDLKSPLATIMGFGELLQMTAGHKIGERENNYIESILATGTRIQNRLEKVLMLHKLTSRTLEKQMVDISSMVHEIADSLKVQAPSRQAQFKIQDGLRTFADPYLLNLAVENLLANAFKYTSKKPMAVIEFGQHEQNAYMTTFKVRDNGDGFDSNKAHELFRPLVRLHDESEFAGTGLGLASVARIIHMHGGTVRAEGKKYEGATFFFQLPIIY